LIRLYLRGDKDGYYEQAREMDIVTDDKRVDRDWLWDWARWFHVPILEDAPFQFTPEYCTQALGQVFGENATKVNMPAEYLMLNRISFGINSILSQLGARTNFRAISLKYYFDEGELPGDE
ncbi:MAG: hypothetical protein GY733_00355, partial [bacterium]|nr:hypothetical protein [bacterium]